MEKIDSVESSLWEFKGVADYTDRKLFMSTPFPIIFILTTYLWFVLKFGPQFMKNRKPFKLDKVLAIYNLVQVVASCYIVSMGFQVIPPNEAFRAAWINPKCYSQARYEQLVESSHLYFLYKVIELLDTVFFVLRKKQNQVSFLHVYHHTVMAFTTWCVVKYTVNDSVFFIGLINTLVHVVMYSYYGLSTFPALRKYLWWKKYITAIQLIQFCMMFLNIVMSHFVSKCEKSFILLFAVTFNTILFFYLFGDFYIKSYTKGRKTNNKDHVIQEAEVSPKDETKNRLNHFINQNKLAAKIN